MGPVSLIPFPLSMANFLPAAGTHGRSAVAIENEPGLRQARFLSFPSDFLSFAF